MLTSIKKEIDSNRIIVEDFNSPLVPMGRSSRQKIYKETQSLNDTLNQLNLIDICRARSFAKSLQSCPNLCDPKDGSPPDSPIPGILQAFSPIQWTSPFSQVHMEHSPGQITSWATNLAVVNFKRLKSFQASFLIMIL